MRIFVPMTECKTFLFLCCLVSATAFAAYPGGNSNSTKSAAKSTVGLACPTVKIEPRRLPDLNVPRVGNVTFVAGGEPVVIGGHTTGFVPTATAEYFSDGEWHLIETAYAHDDAVGVKLSSDKVLIAGGHEKHLGIGQTYPTEVYDPATHSFGDYGCLETKRSLGSGCELDSGRIVISGNWYHGDSIELFDGDGSFRFYKEVSQQRTAPYVLRISRDDALIFGITDPHGRRYADTVVVDRLKGQPFAVPLLAEWPTFGFSIPFQDTNSGFIGDEAKGVFAHLLPVANHDYMNVILNAQPGPDPRLGIVMVRDTVFTLLPTAAPIPYLNQQGDTIFWGGSLLADRNTRCCYLTGYDRQKRLYVLSIDYGALWSTDDKRLLTPAELPQPLPMTLYYTDPQPDMGFNTPVLTDDGNLLIAGGYVQPDGLCSNYLPYASAWLVPLAADGHAAATGGAHWWWWLLLLLALSAVAVCLLWRRRGLHHHINKEEPTAVPVGSDDGSTPAPAAVPASLDVSSSVAGDTIAAPAPVPDAQAELMNRICQLMDEQQLFRNSELKVSDVAVHLGTNTRYVTDCIKSCRGCTFTQLVNGYRVDYAKQLLRKHPDKKIFEVYTEAGFASETSFFRIFKSVTGMTTREWMQQLETPS